MRATVKKAVPAAVVALLTLLVFATSTLAIKGTIISITHSGYGCGVYHAAYTAVYDDEFGNPVYYDGTIQGTYSGIYNTCPSGGSFPPDPAPTPVPTTDPAPTTDPTPEPETPTTPAADLETKVPVAEAKVITTPAGDITIQVPAGFIAGDAEVELALDRVEDEEEAAALADKAKQATLSSGVKTTPAAPPFVLKVTTADGTVKTFALPLKVRMQIPANVDMRKVKVFYIDEDGNTIPVKTKPGSVIFDAIGSGTYVFLEVERDFTDTAHHWAFEDLAVAASQLIVDGYPDGTFKPDGTVTRAEFVAMIVRSLGLPTGDAAALFSDVPADAWYGAALKAAVEKGLINGVGDGKFDPDGLITREQMMVILGRAARATGLPQSNVQLSAFADADKVAAWAQSDVTAAIRTGLIQGARDGLVFKLMPEAETTRAESAVTMLRMYLKAD